MPKISFLLSFAAVCVYPSYCAEIPLNPGQNDSLSQLLSRANDAGKSIKTPAPPQPAPVINERGQYWIVVKAENCGQRTRLATAGMSIEEIYGAKVAGTANGKTVNEIRKMGFTVEFAQPLDQYMASLKTRDFPQEDAAYHNYDEMLQELQSLQKENPEMVSVFSIGKTWQKRDIWAARFNTTDSGTRPSAKPGAVFMGEHHAREHLSVEVPLNLAGYLCANKNKADVKKLLEARDIYIIPMVNPDGAEYDIANGHYQYHRKNMRKNPDNSIGVDINRNYGYLWGGPGASSDPADDTYRGPSAFSEPETRDVKAFIESRKNIKTLISYHSYSELVLYPWSGSEEDVSDANDAKTFKALAAEMAAMTGYTAMKSSDLYVATGDTTDWAYASRGVFAFTIELMPKRSAWGGFYPGPLAIEKASAPNINAAMYLLDMTDDPHRAIQKAPLSPTGLSVDPLGM